jgi:hypothetical protein
MSMELRTTEKFLTFRLTAVGLTRRPAVWLKREIVSPFVWDTDQGILDVVFSRLKALFGLNAQGENMDRKTLEAIDAGNKAIWDAIVYVTKDQAQKAERIGQAKKAKRLRNLLTVMEAKSDSLYEIFEMPSRVPGQIQKSEEGITGTSG